MKTLNINYKGVILEILVDSDIRDKFSAQKFNVMKMSTNPDRFYFRFRKDGKYVYLHRHILGISNSPLLQGDHINGNTLDNRRENLRIANLQQNMYNRRKKVNSSRRYKGVYRVGDGYRCEVIKDGVSFTAGKFPTENSAAIQYNKLATYLFGEYASLNEVI